jgi:hypothetical protein
MNKIKTIAMTTRRILLALQLIIFFAINLAPLVLLLCLTGYIRPAFLADFAHTIVVVLSPVLLVWGNLQARKIFKALKRGKRPVSRVEATIADLGDCGEELSSEGRKYGC